MAVLKGIDVSLHQGVLSQSNWNSIRSGSNTAPPMDFAIIKSSEGTFSDPQFVNNITCASNTDIAIGVYHYFTATTVAGAEAEADNFISVTSPYRNKINLWYAVDIEERAILDLDNSTFYNVVMAIINKLDALNLPVMLYGGDEMFYKFGTHLSDIVSTYAVWYARYWSSFPTWVDPSDGTDRPGVNGRTVFEVDGQPYSDYKIWQFGATTPTHVAGVNGNVDVNFGYFDIPTPPVPPTPPTYSDEIVFHKVLFNNKPQTSPDEKQHIYFTAQTTSSDKSNLYISRKSDRKIIPVSFGETDNISIDINNIESVFTFENGLLKTFSQEQPSQEIQVGSIVQIVEGATYTNGTPVPQSCIGVNYTVSALGESEGVQAALLQEIYSWVSLEYLVLQS